MIRIRQAWVGIQQRIVGILTSSDPSDHQSQQYQCTDTRQSANSSSSSPTNQTPSGGGAMIKSKSQQQSIDMAMALSVLSGLKERDIKLIAFDFDQTIVDIHTKGSWQDTAVKLSPHVRPWFKQFLPAALSQDSNHIHICIVTFSMQPALILETLKVTFPKMDVSGIVVRGSTKDWDRVTGVPILGKQQHIASVISELKQSRAAEIRQHQVLLVDDDKQNVRIAETFGHKGVIVTDTFKLEDLLVFDNLEDEDTGMLAPPGGGGLTKLNGL